MSKYSEDWYVGMKDFENVDRPDTFTGYVEEDSPQQDIQDFLKDVYMSDCYEQGENYNSYI
jgi:hypothetical protein